MTSGTSTRDVAAGLERKPGGVKDTGICEQAERNDHILILPSRCHLIRHLEYLIAPLDGGFSAQLAKPLAQRLFPPDDLNELGQRIKG
ncbi:MAG: hypothetical protein H7X97_09625 [Opitutaceae bacterium]|nr:hypothetical protein [Verrucomicrobiales bacterium]